LGFLGSFRKYISILVNKSDKYLQKIKKSLRNRSRDRSRIFLLYFQKEKQGKMRGNRVTIKHIAKELNISTSTVSRVLSNRPDVSEETRRVVLDLVDAWGYQPDPIAVGLRSKQTHTIGVLVPQIVNRFFSKAISGMQEVADEKVFNLIISQSEETLAKEKVTLQTLINSRVDGLIVAISRETSDISHFDLALDSNTPIVFFDRVDQGQEVSSVLIDDYEASYKSVQHLIDQGCSKVAIVSGPQNLKNYRNRLTGYNDAMRDAGLTVEKGQVVFTESMTRNVRTITEYFLSQSPRPDGFFVINDAFAFEMMSYIKMAGLKVPEDVAIVGFNNETVGEFFDPPLTSVESPAHQLGKEAANLLIDNILSGANKVTEKLIKSELVIRKSSLKSMSVMM
jgi:DNA-binding LacI/PurR family transcriptional regulator